MTRREIREHVFVMLFQGEFHDAQELAELNQFYSEFYMQKVSEEEKKYIEERFEKVRAQLGVIDPVLTAAASGWKLNRMGKVELTILRLAVFEMKYDEEIPEKVAINEAVELAKKFGGDASAGFVNGVLAKLAQKNA